jgi:hypothetical protein
MFNEIAGTGNRIRPASREVQQERAIARIQKTTLEDLEPSFQARREFGSQYGYANSAEWWEAMQSSYDLPDELCPEWVSFEEEVADDPVVAFVQEYDGDFEFLLSLQKQLKQGRELTAGQYGGAARCMERQVVKPPIVEDDDPVIQFVREYTGGFSFVLSLKEQLGRGRTLSPKQYAGAEKCMKAELRKAERAQREPVTEGMYLTEDQRIFKVQRAVNGSGNLYAKELVADEVHGNVFGTVQQYANGKPRWKFRYAKGAISQLRAEEKMTLEQAKEFGALYGTCMVCGRTLTDETSIAEGIGPICAGRMTEWL